MLRACRKPGIEKSRRKIRMIMRKILSQVCLLLFIAGQAYSQNFDDGYVTNGLPVNTSSEKFITYMKNFQEGVDKVMKGEITSNDQIVREYGINIMDFPRLSSVVATANWSAYNNQFSQTFLRDLNAIFVRSGSENETVLSIRTALKDMRYIRGFSSKEAEALAAIDITVQEVARKFLTSMTGTAARIGQIIPGFSAAMVFSNIYLVRQNISQVSFCNYLKLPGWARCVLGVIGDAIMGGFTGMKFGAVVGGPVGAAILGIIGVVGGTFSGAARYC